MTQTCRAGEQTPVTIVSTGSTLRVGLIGLVVVAGACAPGRDAAPTRQTADSLRSAGASALPSRPGTVVSSATIAQPASLRMSAPGGALVWVLVGDVLLFRSMDAGTMWEQRPLPVEASQIGPTKEISFVSDREGLLLVAGSPASQCQQQSVQIWHTLDGGGSYEPISVMTTSTGTRTPAGISPAQCKSGLSFIDRLHGFISAWDPNSAPVVYRTVDGGRDWQVSAPLPDPPGFQTRGGGFALQPGAARRFGAELLLAARGISTAGQLNIYVFSSSDDGQTWNYAATAPESLSMANWKSAVLAK